MTMRFHSVLFVVIVCTITPFPLHAQTPAPTTAVTHSAKFRPIVIRSPNSATREIHLPGKITFCNESIDTDRRDISERLETQIRIWSRNTGQIELWVKRRERFFPLIVSILTETGLPADLKYVPVIESALRTGAMSSRAAVGPWQFIRATGKKYGLRIDRWIDERRDIRKSTRAALQYLNDLHTEFGSWPTALAAYNIGENRIRAECYRQGTSDYFEMLLPYETDRYVINIIVAKLILENPAAFGLDFSKLAPFAVMKTQSIPFAPTRSIPVAILAYAAGMTYREFRQQNPWIIGATLPKGNYVLNIPDGNKPVFPDRIAMYRKKTNSAIRFRHSKKFTVQAEQGNMRIGPDFSYPVLRRLSQGKELKIVGRTKKKDKGHFWYLFRRRNGAEGWIWGGEIVRS